MNTKINVTLDTDLIKRADDFADDNYMSRSGLISLALTQYLNQNDIIRAVNDISISMRKIADNKELSDEEVSNLKDFETMAKMLIGKQALFFFGVSLG